MTDDTQVPIDPRLTNPNAAFVMTYGMLWQSATHQSKYSKSELKRAEGMGNVSPAILKRLFGFVQRDLGYLKCLKDIKRIKKTMKSEF